MRKLICFMLVLISTWSAATAQKLGAPELIALANARSPELRAAIETSMDAKSLKDGSAWVSRGPDFFFALQAATEPKLMIDEAVGPPMTPIAGTPLWYGVAHIQPVSQLHEFHYMVAGAKFGGRIDLPALGPLSYLLQGVPSGKLSEKMIHTSKMYDGMKSEYWIYVPAQYDAKTPAAVMVFQDGEGYSNRNGDHGVLNVIDNLIAQKKIPVMICVFINPGDISESLGTPTYSFVKSYSEKWHRTLKDSMRSTLYDTVSDRYPRFLRDEILADVGAKFNLRKDAYSHAITGLSSGGICAFNAAWQMPDYFSRVITWIGSFESIQWKEDASVPDGGQDFQDKVLREPHRNMRVWLQDGSNDLENPNYGDWPMANIRMANSLKTKGYDFHFSFGKGSHDAGHGAAQFPEEMTWLWRDYDPTKTEQIFIADPAEKDKPYFRVTITSRDAN